MVLIRCNRRRFPILLQGVIYSNMHFYHYCIYCGFDLQKMKRLHTACMQKHKYIFNYTYNTLRLYHLITFNKPKNSQQFVIQ